MRIIGSLVSFLLFTASYLLYLYYESILHFSDKRVLKLWNYYSLAFIIFSIWVIEYFRVTTMLQESILRGAKFVVALVFADIILTNHGIIKNPYSNLIIFMVGSGFSLVILLIEIIRSKRSNEPKHFF